MSPGARLVVVGDHIGERAPDVHRHAVARHADLPSSSLLRKLGTGWR